MEGVLETEEMRFSASERGGGRDVDRERLKQQQYMKMRKKKI